MTVPTPVTWSTWTVIARRPGGTRMSRIWPAWPPVSVRPVMAASLTTACRTVWPRTWEVSPNASTSRPASGFCWTVTISAVMRAPRAMSFVAMTVAASVGSRVAGSSPPPGRRKRTATNATIARKTPTSKTKRLERFKRALPETWCDRWHHCSIVKEARDYTNGLGPRGRKRQEPLRVARSPARFAGRGTTRSDRGPGGSLTGEREDR